jgi:hypothetical protein
MIASCNPLGPERKRGRFAPWRLSNVGGGTHSTMGYQGANHEEELNTPRGPPSPTDDLTVSLARRSKSVNDVQTPQAGVRPCRNPSRIDASRPVYCKGGNPTIWPVLKSPGFDSLFKLLSLGTPLWLQLHSRWARNRKWESRTRMLDSQRNDPGGFMSEYGRTNDEQPVAVEYSRSCPVPARHLSTGDQLSWAVGHGPSRPHCCDREIPKKKRLLETSPFLSTVQLGQAHAAGRPGPLAPTAESH